MLQTDKGSEFRNAHFQSLLKESGIRIYIAENYVFIAAIVESFNGTFRTRMYRYFTHSKSFGFVDVLQDLVYSYNHSYHISIRREPAMVASKKKQRVRRKLLHLQSEKPKGRLQTVNKWEPVRDVKHLKRDTLPTVQNRLLSSATDSPPLLQHIRSQTWPTRR